MIRRLGLVVLIMALLVPGGLFSAQAGNKAPARGGMEARSADPIRAGSCCGGPKAPSAPPVKACSCDTGLPCCHENPTADPRAAGPGAVSGTFRAEAGPFDPFIPEATQPGGVLRFSLAPNQHQANGPPLYYLLLSLRI
jgi:hypothetical protein